MPLTISLDLSDRDLEHFTRARAKASQLATGKSNDEIIEGAMRLLEKAQQSDPPEFVKDRLNLLDTLVAMLRDEGWALAEADAANVRAALVYFAVEADAIPDEVPVLGFLDDAIMIELCACDLRNELDAYNDFCDFRQHEAERRGLEPGAVGRADWLGGRREELQSRMRRRRERGFGGGYGRSSGYGPVGGYCSDGWRPGVFKFR